MSKFGNLDKNKSKLRKEGKPPVWIAFEIIFTVRNLQKVIRFFYEA